MLTQRDPRVQAGERSERRAEGRRVLVLEVANPRPHGLSEHVGSFTRGDPQLIQYGRRVSRVPVA